MKFKTVASVPLFPEVLLCLLFLSASSELVKLLSNSRNSANKQQLHYCFQINVYLNDLVKDEIEMIKQLDGEHEK